MHQRAVGPARFVLSPGDAAQGDEATERQGWCRGSALSTRCATVPESFAVIDVETTGLNPALDRSDRDRRCRDRRPWPRPRRVSVLVERPGRGTARCWCSSTASSAPDAAGCSDDSSDLIADQSPSAERPHRRRSRHRFDLDTSPIEFEPGGTGTTAPRRGNAVHQGPCRTVLPPGSAGPLGTCLVSWASSSPIPIRRSATPEPPLRCSCSSSTWGSMSRSRVCSESHRRSSGRRCTPGRSGRT